MADTFSAFPATDAHTVARTFLIRGLVCGLVAGVLVFLYAKVFGEPPVEGAIGVEAKLAPAGGEVAEPELVSRILQAGWGLFVATMLYALAIGGMFSLLFAFAWGRMGRLGARATAAMLACASFVAVYLVPYLKYPANPPSVGNPETIGYRTALYLGMIVISIGAMIAALNLGRALLRRLEAWHAVLVAGAAYVAIIAISFTAMPAVNEVPPSFPADLLWQFRLAALGMQLVLWTALGLLFGELTERASRAATTARKGAHRPHLAEH
jgi:hypothetical protein